MASNKRKRGIEEQRHKAFLEAVKRQVNFTSAWRVSQQFGVSNSANLVEGGLQIGGINLDSLNSIPPGAIVISRLRFPPAGEIYFALVIKNDCDRLTERLQLMKNNSRNMQIGVSRGDPIAKLSNGPRRTGVSSNMQYSIRNNLVVFFLADDGKVYLRNKGFWQNGLPKDRSHLEPTVNIDKVFYAVYPPEPASKRDPIVQNYVRFFITLVGQRVVEEIFPWTENKTLFDVLEDKKAPDNGAMPIYNMNIYGPVEAVIYGEYNTAILQHHNGERQVPFLAPPRPMSDLIGRDDLLHTMKRRLFSKGDLALSALQGLPGVGKTALALALVYDKEVSSHFCDGILWAGLGPEPNKIYHLTMWGVALGIPLSEMEKLTQIGTGTEALERAITSRIGARRMLLIIDDAWSAKAALDFRVGGENCAHLVTTRFYEIAGRFASLNSILVGELGEDAGINLLEKLAPGITEVAPRDAKELVREVGGLPLALTLMGNYLRIQMGSGQSRRVRAALDVLHDARTRLKLSQPDGGLGRHTSIPEGVPLSLAAVIKVSDESLDVESRQALRALSVFPPKPNTFSEEAALAVSGASVAAIDSLTDFGLLESSSDSRYTLHQVICDYGRTALTDKSIVYERMEEYYSRYLQEHLNDNEMLDQELSNILEATERHLERGGAATFAYFMRYIRNRGI